MDQIIAGRFQTKAEADVAAARMANYVNKEDITVFHNNSPGQHGTYPVGGDENADPDAREAGSPNTSAAAGLTVGVIGTVIGGPVIGLTAGGVAAYTSSLVGALNAMEETGANGEPSRRPGGIILAVRIASPDTEKRVILDLQEHGAADIERAYGEWRNGDWVDFNPVERPKLVPETNTHLG